MPAYSFKDVVAAIVGPGGGFDLGSGPTGAGAAQEGITIEPTADANIMTTGADGSVMHSMVVASSATITVRLLKTSPINAALMRMYNTQKQSSRFWGKNSINVADTARTDLISAQEVAFARVPNLTYAQEGGNNEWVFHAGRTQYTLGVGNLP